MNNRQPDSTSVGEKLSMLTSETSRLGLRVTKEHIDTLVTEIVNANPNCMTPTLDGKFQFTFDTIDAKRVCHHLENIYVTMRAELGAILFRAIPKERAEYNNAEWLKKSVVQTKFPTSFKELERAGVCYSLGQPTASVFHCMRALEPALTTLAASFKISTSHEYWQKIIEQIEGAVRALGQQPKSQQKIDDETFFDSATSHLYFVKNAWRNHVAHARDSYSDDEAVRILSHTLEFIESLCPRLEE
jgi:hypothetical protein